MTVLSPPIQIDRASVNLDVDEAVPAARFDAGDVPSGRSDWLPLQATGTDAAGRWVEVTLLGGIEIRRSGAEAETAFGQGGVAATAGGLLWRLGQQLGEPACPHEDGDCACADGGAALVGDELRLWFGEAERPTRTLAPVTLDELARLATLWSSK